MERLEVDQYVAEALKAGVEIGHGTSRVCLEVPGHPELCVKRCYLTPGSTRGSNAWKSYAGRFSKTYCQAYREWRYLGYLRQMPSIPHRLLDAFPSVYEVTFHPEFGWIGLMERVLNADGSKPRHIESEIAAQPDLKARQELFERFCKFIDEIVHARILYTDIGNTLVQYDADGASRFKIVDFEQHRQFFGSFKLGFEYVMPRWYIASRVLRRKRRFRKKTAARSNLSL